MSIFEYDEEKELKLIREAEYEEGRESGKRDYLMELVSKKLAKGKTVAQIAAELEEEASVIGEVVRLLKTAEETYRR